MAGSSPRSRRAPWTRSSHRRPGCFGVAGASRVSSTSSRSRGRVLPRDPRVPKHGIRIDRSDPSDRSEGRDRSGPITRCGRGRRRGQASAEAPSAFSASARLLAPPAASRRSSHRGRGRSGAAGASRDSSTASSPRGCALPCKPRARRRRARIERSDPTDASDRSDRITRRERWQGRAHPSAVAPRASSACDRFSAFRTGSLAPHSHPPELSDERGDPDHLEQSALHSRDPLVRHVFEFARDRRRIESRDRSLAPKRRCVEP